MMRHQGQEDQGLCVSFYRRVELGPLVDEARR